jgi:hypothetical protein
VINCLTYDDSSEILFTRSTKIESKNTKHDMTKYQKYCKAVKFVRTVKKQTLDNGVTIEPFSDTVVISHKDCRQLGGFCSTALGMQRLINKTAKEAASL